LAGFRDFDPGDFFFNFFYIFFQKRFFYESEYQKISENFGNPPPGTLGFTSNLAEVPVRTALGLGQLFFVLFHSRGDENGGKISEIFENLPPLGGVNPPPPFGEPPRIIKK
jgi:hypothetical protein